MSKPFVIAAFVACSWSPRHARAASSSAPDPSERTHAVSVAVIAGAAIPVNGLAYGLGIGLRGGVNLGNFYFGALLATHQGDSKSINWGSTFSSDGGKQTYTSHPVIVAADVGYDVNLPLAGVETVFTPNLSAGVILMPMDSSGVYGNSSITKVFPVIGIGLTYVVRLQEHFFAGAHYRVYNVGDANFHFGDSSQGTYDHGFSTSVFYHALYAELGYRF